MEVPKNLELEVTETAPGVKGNTVSGGTKSAKLETGAVIQVYVHAACICVYVAVVYGYVHYACM